MSVICDQQYWTDPEYRNADAGLKQLTTGRNANTGLFSGIPAFTHDFQHHIARITPSAVLTYKVTYNRVYPFP
jgi:hypothetical protein